MTEKYFAKFPIINYANTATRNITERVVMLTLPRVAPINFHPWEVIENMRADHVASQYYDDSSLDWLIYLTNNILDPYYGWPMDADEFDNYIIKKYGSLEYAEQKVLAFRTNWTTEDNTLPPTYYDNAPTAIKKYFAPIWSDKKIIGYERRREDWVVSTNEIITLQCADENIFTADDILVASFGGLETGRCEVLIANGFTLTCQHTVNNIDIGNTISPRGSSNSTTITNKAVLATNIPEDEAAFWDPVYYYDAENELNASRRFINLLDSSYHLETSEAIRKQLNA